MKRFLLSFFILISFFKVSLANHITGGEMYYTYLGQSGTNFQYRVTLKLFRDHFSTGAQLDPSAVIGIFDRVTGATISINTVSKTNEVQLVLTSPDPCITNPPVVHYDIGYYEFDISLPGSANGYIIAYQRCCRINGINNLGGATGVGATYIAEIPSIAPLATAPINNSAKFIGPDTVIVCADNPFSYSFAASDADSDELSYSFCSAYTGGTTSAPAPNPPASPPYFTVPYGSPFSSASPLGSAVSLNTTTGLISGIAPAAGIYVVTVCVTEKRNGIIIAVQRKDLQIKVGDCNPLRAQLDPIPTTCDGFTVNFNNNANNPTNTDYLWTFGEPASGSNNTSTLATPSHTYLDTGVYKVSLTVSLAGLCTASDTFFVKVYPGFFPGFTVSGGCFQNPYQFTDTTKATYGVVNNWRWNFGDASTLADTSRIRTPQWTFANAGPKTAQLIVSSSKGCIDTTTLDFTVLDRPIVDLAFRDTLICIPDRVTLNATSTSGSFSWSPTTNMTNPNSPNPTVNPTTNTWYVVTLNDNGCQNKDSVHVRVVPNVTLRAIADTTICLTDAVQLNAVTNGLTYQWTATSGTLSNPTILNPSATPTAASTTYNVVATIGSCTASDQVIVNTVPYPVADAGLPQIICYNTSAQLNGSHNGNSFTWSPTAYLNNPLILNPISTPPRTTAYVLTVFDNAGCPKPGRDTVVVTVQPRVRAFAGRDTIVIVGQPLQFNGTGGVSYVWSPSTGLSSTTIYNPVGVYNSSIDTVRYKLVVTDAAGCTDSAYVTVRVFRTKATVFVPTGFTPNNDGLNDIVAPVCVGIRNINYFSIYNRWGQLVFTTTMDRHGWDGKISGRLQGSGVFAWMLSAVDYTGKTIFLKGTVALIR